MSDRIKDSYKASKNIYDDILTRKTLFAKLYMKLFWQDVDDNKIAAELLKYIPDRFLGKLLDVPVGTGVFTCEKYKRMTKADITCLDYSADMMENAKKRAAAMNISNVAFVQGDVGALPFEDENFDLVLSLNGFHAFPDKDAAYRETFRVLKKGGVFCGCFYIAGEFGRTDWFVKHMYVPKGFFTPPFETEESLKARLQDLYSEVGVHTVRAEGIFRCVK